MKAIKKSAFELFAYDSPRICVMELKVSGSILSGSTIDGNSNEDIISGGDYSDDFE